MRRVLRYEVPVDDQEHTFKVPLSRAVLTPLHVAHRGRLGRVDVWFECEDGATEKPVTLRVFGTGHPIPAGWDWAGTCLTPDGTLVWHVYGRDLWGVA